MTGGLQLGNHKEKGTKIIPYHNRVVFSTYITDHSETQAPFVGHDYRFLQHIIKENVIHPVTAG